MSLREYKRDRNRDKRRSADYDAVYHAQCALNEAIDKRRP